MSKDANRKKSHSYDGKLASLLKKMSTGRNRDSVISEIKSKFERPDILRFVKLLSVDSNFSASIIGNPFPKNLKSLKASSFLTFGAFDTEIYWASCIAKLYIQELNKFIVLRDRFSKAILLSNFVEADLVLSSIELEFGVSIWLIENKVSLLSSWKGLEQQKEYVKSITQRQDVPQNVRYMTYYFGVRAEQNVSPEKYSSSVALSLFDSNSPPRKIDSWQYFTFKLDFFGGEIFRDLSSVIYFESDSSIIDRYMTLVRVCQLAVAYNKEDKQIRSVARVVSLLYPDIIDAQLEILSSVIGRMSSPKSEQDNNMYEILNSYTNGEYSECVKNIGPLVKLQPTNISLLELYVKSHNRIETKCEPLEIVPSLARICDGIASILLLDEASSETQSFVAKYLRIYSSHSWAAQLYSFLVREYLYDSVSVPHRYVIFGELNSPILNPRIGSFLRRSGGTIGMSSIVWFDNYSSAGSLLNLINRPSEDSIRQMEFLHIPQERRLRHMASIYREIGQLDKAVDIYDNLLITCPKIVYYDVLRQAAFSTIESNDYKNALLLIVNAYLVNSQAGVRLPVKQLIDAVEHASTRDLESMIELPILYDMQFRRLGTHEEERTEAYERYINNVGVERPSQLEFDRLATSKIAFVYFLRHICVPEVMDASMYFSGSDDVQRERLKVCQILLELDGVNADTYLTEIRTLTTRIAVARGLRDVQQSKIYVDVDGVRRTLEKDLHESYSRYIDLVRHTPDDVSTEILIRALRRAAARLDMPSKIYIPPSERGDLLATMVRDIRDGFVSSNEYGLDTSLSMGIRHGTLSGQLRPRLAAVHLITLKDSKEGKYQPNSFWLDRIPPVAVSTIATVSNALDRLSTSVDALIDKINSVWMQVRTETKNPDGMFDFRLNEISFQKLRLQITPETSFEQFFDLVIQEMWAATDEALRLISLRFQNEIKPQFLALLTELEVTLNSLWLGDYLSEIFQTITQAKIDMQYDLERVMGWFARARPAEIRDYPAILPVDLGLQTLENVYATLPIRPTMDVDESLEFKGKTLTGMTNIMYNLFDNTRKYSKSDGAENALVQIKKNGHMVEFLMVNDVDVKFDPATENARIDDIRSAIMIFRAMKRIPVDRVKREGRSGFFKIAKVVMFDLLADCDLAFDYTAHHTFEVRFSISADILLS